MEMCNRCMHTSSITVAMREVQVVPFNLVKWLLSRRQKGATADEDAEKGDLNTHC